MKQGIIHMYYIAGTQKFQTKTNWVLRTNGNLMQVGLF